MASAGRFIEAAGGVLWRGIGGSDEVEVAIVHRPKYDDWSIPKGKLHPGEHPLAAALREVEEETGFTGRPGRSLGELRYLKDGFPKRVRYWAVEAETGSFAPGDEVDELLWLPPKEAQRNLGVGRDEKIIDNYLADIRRTVPCIVVRHCRAGERSTWSGDDRKRPLDDEGRRQAQALVPLFGAFDLRRVYSADVQRCLETVRPFADKYGLAIEREPLLSESGYAISPDAAAEWLLRVLDRGEPALVCSQGKAIPPLMTRVCAQRGDKPFEGSVPKGGFVVLQVAASQAGTSKSRLAAVDVYPAA